MATEWSLTRTQYALSERPYPINKNGHAGILEVGVPGSLTGTESADLQEMFGEEETEAGTIDETVMRIAARGGSSKSSGAME